MILVSNDTEASYVVRTQDIARTLLGGTVSITAAEVDNGSTDNWGIASFSLNKTEFNCSNIGDNQVILQRHRQGLGMSLRHQRSSKVQGVIPAPEVAVIRRVGLIPSHLAMASSQRR